MKFKTEILTDHYIDRVNKMAACSDNLSVFSPDNLVVAVCETIENDPETYLLFPIARAWLLFHYAPHVKQGGVRCFQSVADAEKFMEDMSTFLDQSNWPPQDCRISIVDSYLELEEYCYEKSINLKHCAWVRPDMVKVNGSKAHKLNVVKAI